MVPEEAPESGGAGEPHAAADAAPGSSTAGGDPVVIAADAQPPMNVPGGGVAGDPLPDRVSPEAVAALGARFDRGFEELKAIVLRENRAEAAREKVIDRLHAELQEYKQDLLFGTLRPVFLDLVQLHDDLGKAAAAPAEAGADGPAESRGLVGIIEGFQQGIEDILYRQGVEPFQVDGDAFDPRRQRAVATVATDEPGLNKTVAARLRQGFRAGDRVIRPELVSVFALKR